KKEQPAAWRETAGRFIAQTTKTLQSSPGVIEWLRLERGIAPETAERFQLGFIDHNCFRQKSEWGLPPDGKKLFIPSGLVIPWQSSRLRIRRNDPGEYQGKPNPRYHVVAGSSMAPMAIGAPGERTAVMVESELDAILLAQEIKREVFIVALGSCAVKPDEALLNNLLSCPVVLVVLDTDEAGAKASQWWLEKVPSTYRTLTPTTFGKDITAAFLNGLDLNKWLSASMELYAESVGGKPESTPF
ncbi:MAG: P4 alpha zinc-binding protein, partial [uncultured bacterium]